MCARVAAVAVVGGHLQNGYLKQGKDVKKDGETRAKRGERLVKNSKWNCYFFFSFFNELCSAVAFFSSSSCCFTPRKHAHRLSWLD